MDNTSPIKPLFYNTEKMVKQPPLMYRTNVGAKRYYYNIDENGSVVKLPSVTSILGSTMPTSEYLIKWISQYGYEKAEQIKRQKADYGTLMHICLSDFLVDGFFDIESLDLRIKMFKTSNHIDYDTKYWKYELEKDIYAFHKFAADYQVTPIAISLMMSSKKLGFAGEIDLAVEMIVGNGQNGKILKTDLKNNTTRKITAIMDWKSGRHGFFPANEAQLHMYHALWKEHYPHIPIDALYNWSPKDWNEEPDYNLKDQMQSTEALKIQHYTDLFYISENLKTPKTYTSISGKLILGHLNGNLKVESFEEKILRIHSYPGKKELTKQKNAGLAHPAKRSADTAPKAPQAKLKEVVWQEEATQITNENIEQLKIAKRELVEAVCNGKVEPAVPTDLTAQIAQAEVNIAVENATREAIKATNETPTINETKNVNQAADDIIDSLSGLFETANEINL